MYTNNNALVNLGFTAEKLPHGAHICQIYSQESDRESALLSFIESGLRANERVACLSDNTTNSQVSRWLNQKGLNSADFRSNSQLSFASSHDSYFDDTTFNPEPMLEVFKSFHQDSKRESQSGARVIVETHPSVAEGQSLLKHLDYMAQVNLLQEEHPVTTLYQYNTAIFEGATLMRVFKVHPLLAVNGAIIRNPFFIPARDFLASSSREAF